MGDQNNGTMKQVITDPQRIDFYRRHLIAVRKAMGYVYIYFCQILITKLLFAIQHLSCACISILILYFIYLNPSWFNSLNIFS